jgi:hypothetical protein
MSSNTWQWLAIAALAAWLLYERLVSDGAHEHVVHFLKKLRADLDNLERKVVDLERNSYEQQLVHQRHGANVPTDW